MRITFVLPYAPLAGGTRVVLIHAEKLRDRGHTVWIVTPPPKSPRLRDRARMLLKGRRPTWGTNRGLFAGFSGEHVIADYTAPGFAARIPDADVVVATWWETAFSVMALPPEKGQKAYFVQHHEVHDHLPSHFSAGSYYLPMKKIVVSSWLATVMSDLYGDREVSVVPNSVDPGQFDAPTRGRRPTPTIGFMYSRSIYKGADLAAEVIRRVQQDIPNLSVVAFGKPDARAGHELPEATTYFRQPSQKRLRTIYAMCDVWLMPSLNEGFGLPILEAMACRTPVISTRSGAAADIIRDGENGFLVDVGNVCVMAMKIIELLNRPEADWKRMSEAAKTTAAGYSWSDATDRFEQALAALAQR